MWITSVYPLQSLGAGVVGSTSRDGCIRIWNVDIGVCDRVIEAHRQSTNALLQLPNGHLLTASEDKSIRVWNVRAQVKGMKWLCWALCMSAFGRSLASRSQ